MNLEKITSGEELVSLFPDKFNSNMETIDGAVTENTSDISALDTRMTTAEGEIARALGMRLSPQSLVLRTPVTGTQTLTTYSGRKFSDYPLVLITTGVGADVRSSALLPTSVFDDGAAVILNVLHGSNASTVTSWSVSTASIKYISDTSIEVTIAGSGAANYVAVYGITLAA